MIQELKVNYFYCFIFFAFIFGSCLDDDNGENISLTAVRIDSIQIGEINAANQITEITTYFNRSADCAGFYAYDYRALGNERTVIAYLFNRQQVNCGDEAVVDSSTIDFRPANGGEYNFRFWQGQDSSGNNLFLEYDIEIPD